MDIAGYPEAEAELERIRDFYTREVNALRRGVALAPETWRKVRIHFLGECKCVHTCLSRTDLPLHGREKYRWSPFTVAVYWRYVVSQGDTPSLDSFLDKDTMEGFLASIKVWL